MQPGKIYVGGEQDRPRSVRSMESECVAMWACSSPVDALLLLCCCRLKKHPWMKARFQKMGGKYNQWYTTKVTDRHSLGTFAAFQLVSS